jgi:hypothetical protein
LEIVHFTIFQELRTMKLGLALPNLSPLGTCENIINFARSGHPLESQRQFLTGTVELVRQNVQQLASWGATEVFFSLRNNLPALEDAFRVILEQMRLLSGVREERYLPIRHISHSRNASRVKSVSS